MKTSHRNPSSIRFIFRLVAAAAWLIAVIPSTAPGQALGDAPLVGKIDLQFERVRNISDEAVLANIRLREGSPYSQALLDQSIRTLYETGNYDYIETIRSPREGGVVDVVFILYPKYRVSEVRIEGNKEIRTSRLRREIETEAGMALDEVRVKRDADKLFRYYQENSFPNAVVEFSITRDDELGTGIVTYRIDEGDELKIANIEFVGNDSIDSSDLRDVMSTSEYFWLWSWATGSGKFEEDKFIDDLEKLRDFYRDHGFLDVEVPALDVRFEYPSENRMDVLIKIIEGRRYDVGEIRFQGNKLYTSEQLMQVLRVSPGATFSPSKVDQSVESLRDFYGQFGYLDTFVRAERIPNINTGAIDLVFTIEESEKFRVETINIAGNTKTRADVILRELALAPGDVFDTIRMKNSESRLRNTRYFESVTLSPEYTNIPNRRALRIQVEEGRTGNLTFGAGFSTVESVVLFAELTQSNFDIFNYRNMFQGGGQKFRLRLAIGNQSNQIMLSFEEPWVFQRELAFGFDIFRTESDYLSSDYNELRTGFEVYLRKRLFELVEGRLSYGIENIDIKDVQATAPVVIRQEAGNRLLSKVGFTLLRDTRDNLVFPTTGSRLQLTQEVAGPFPGNTDFYRIEARAGHWWPTFDFASQVFEVSGRIGSVSPFNNQTVPFFERFYLGGPYSLRGFRFREVGPKDPATGEPIGGNSYAFFSLEYTFKVLEPLRLAAFYDWGFVNANDFNFDPSNYNDDWGVGARILVLGAPLRLDLGFPLRTDQYNDKGIRFNFSFGTVF